MPHGVTHIFLAGEGLYTRGVIHEKKFLMRIYTEKVTPGLHRGKNRRFKKFHFAFAAKKGVMFYTRGLCMRHYGTFGFEKKRIPLASRRNDC